MYHDVDFHSVRTHAETAQRSRLRQSDAFNVGVSASVTGDSRAREACFCHLVKLLRSSMTKDARDGLSHELMSPCW